MITKELAEKICDLTGYGGALHPNDILPDLEKLVAEARSECADNYSEALSIASKAWFKQGEQSERSLWLKVVEDMLDNSYEIKLESGASYRQALSDLKERIQKENLLASQRDK